MKRSIRLLLTAAALSFSPVPPAFAADSAPAASAEHATPLMVIRFNRPNVDYSMPLYNTLSRALKVKPSAMFDIVSVAPQAQVAHNQPYYDNLATENTNKVLATLKDIGLPARRFTTTSITDVVDATEVRIYVH